MAQLTEQQMSDLCYDTYKLLQTMSNLYGPDESWKMFETFWTVLGDDVRNHLFLKMLDSDFTTGKRGTLTAPNGFTNTIAAIKAVRCYASLDENFLGTMGLKEAKDLVDAAKYGGKSVLFFKDSQNKRAFIQEIEAQGGKLL